MGFLLIPEQQRHILSHTLEDLPELQLVRKLEKGGNELCLELSTINHVDGSEIYTHAHKYTHTCT